MHGRVQVSRSNVSFKRVVNLLVLKGMCMCCDDPKADKERALIHSFKVSSEVLISFVSFILSLLWNFESIYINNYYYSNYFFYKY